MRSLYVISSSLVNHPEAAVLQGIESFVAGASKLDTNGSIVACPENLALPNIFGDVVRYNRPFGMEACRDIWTPWRHDAFDRIYVLGTTPLADYEEIATVCFLDSRKKLYLNSRGGKYDIKDWEKDIRADFSPGPVHIQLCTADEQDRYIRRVQQRMTAELIADDFGPPTPLGVPDPTVSLYTRHRLARDLGQLTTGLQIEAHDAPFSLLKMPDGTIVRSRDYHRALANFVSAIDGVDDVLDVGCGSGFLSCHLAGLGCYRSVLGIDSSDTRIDSARLHADLVGSNATFAQTGMTKLALADKSVDLTVTSYALEQSGRELAAAVEELRRVTRKFIVLSEPSSQYFTTLPGIRHMERNGWANSYFEVLSGLNYAVRPSLLSQYFNPGSIFVIDLADERNPTVRFPHLFNPAVEHWPGGVELS
ncbi:MAG: Methyltransferase type 11 [Nitrobacter vulgaris]|nr:Methyltransferase type 11 [Nitrobacter vulgaris]